MAKTINQATTKRGEEVNRLVAMMTFAAWAALGFGILLSLFNLNHFSDKNMSLMIGIGFMVGSVFIYVIRTAIHLVHSVHNRDDGN